MSLTKIKGRDVVLTVTKDVNGVATPVVVGCATDISLDVDTDSDEATCQASGDAKEFEPGQYTWTASPNLNVREARNDPNANPPGTDADDNVTAEDFLDFQIKPGGSQIFTIKFTVGSGSKAAKYTGQCFVNKSSLKGQQKGIATYAVGLQGTGLLVKSI